MRTNTELLNHWGLTLSMFGPIISQISTNSKPKFSYMNAKILDFIKNHFTHLQTVGIADKSTTIGEYLSVAQKVLQEQEDKIKISDKNINYNDEILSIEPVGEMETVDITVTGDSLFFCNGILTKNSIGLAATADVCCSLWQTDTDREVGVINMGFMKNRFGPNFGHGAFQCNYNTLTLTETNTDYFANDASPQDDVIKTVDGALEKLKES